MISLFVCGVNYCTQEAHQYCVLYVYTHGTRAYAEGVASILDPTRKLFGHRIFSRTDVPDLGSAKVIGCSQLCAFPPVRFLRHYTR